MYRPRKIADPQLSDIARELERISRDVATLSRQTERLCARIRPYAGEPEPMPDEPNDFLRKPKPKGVPELYEIARSLALAMDGPLFNLRLIAARIDQIHNDSWSRADLKAHMEGRQDKGE